MKKQIIILCLLAACFSFSCNKEIQKQREIIRGMEAAIQKNASDQFLRPLMANYINYSVDFPEDEMTPIYLYRAAVLYYRVGNNKEAVINLETILREYPETEILEDTYLLLAMICAKGGLDKKRATELYTIYKEKYPQGKGIDQVEYFFKTPEEKLAEHIKKIQTEIEQLPRGQENHPGKNSQLMWAMSKYVKLKPNDPLAPAYCLKGAQIAMAQDMHLAAVELLDLIYRNYTDFEQYPDALLLLAVEYDNLITLYLKQGNVVSLAVNPEITAKKLEKMDLVAKGGELYREILRRFPEHDVAVSAKSGLKNLGKRTQKVVDEFVRVQDSLNRVSQPIK